jgi:hypothetical protein
MIQSADKIDQFFKTIRRLMIKEANAPKDTLNFGPPLVYIKMTIWRGGRIRFQIARGLGAITIHIHITLISLRMQAC